MVDTALKLLAYHFVIDDDSARAVKATAFKLIMRTTAEVWHRCELFFEREPFTLAGIVDPQCEDLNRCAVPCTE